MPASMHQFIRPSWEIDSVNACSTTRLGGFGSEPFNSFNLGLHVGDDPEVVARNRRKLLADLKLPKDPVWLDQVHGTDVIYASKSISQVPRADALWTDQRGCVLSIMTADCLPVLFSSRGEEVVAAAHAGWRGLAAGVLQNTVAQLPVAAEELCAWLGPAIGPGQFEIGEDVFTAFHETDPGCDSCFRRSSVNSEKYYADIFALCRRCLQSIGVTEIYGGDHCTFDDEEHFFSYRRDQGHTGRMASLIWLTLEADR